MGWLVGMSTLVELFNAKVSLSFFQAFILNTKNLDTIMISINYSDLIIIIICTHLYGFKYSYLIQIIFPLLYEANGWLVFYGR